MRKEAVQVGAMAARFLMMLDALDADMSQHGPSGSNVGGAG